MPSHQTPQAQAMLLITGTILSLTGYRPLIRNLERFASTSESLDRDYGHTMLAFSGYDSLYPRLVCQVHKREQDTCRSDTDTKEAERFYARGYTQQTYRLPHQIIQAIRGCDQDDALMIR